MKTHGIKLLAFIVLSFNFSFAQNFSIGNSIGAKVELNKNNTPCLNETQIAEIQAVLKENKKLLKEQGKLMPINKAGGHPLFVWPVAQADGFDFESNWAIRSHVDHDPAFPDQYVDYNCGTRTYDTADGNHQGLDIVPWPFYWKQMDDDQAQVIAAEAGQILAKDDGNYDQNCTPNNDSPNSIYIQHSDGSEAWYSHLKNGSLTSKGIGDFVEQGEYLGIIGSSGSSELPHLHFQVWDSSGNVIDPYFGDCNTMNPDTWWLEQRPYIDPFINEISSHSAQPVITDCPEGEETNFQNIFYEGDIIYFVVFASNIPSGSIVDLTWRTPDNSIHSTYTYEYTGSWLYVYSTFPSEQITSDHPVGTWAFEASLNGQTVIHPFEIGILGTEDSSLSETTVYPNPLQNTLFIDSAATIVAADIRDVLGRTVSNISDTTRNINEIDVSFLTKGMYFITLVSDENQSKTIKLIKE